MLHVILLSLFGVLLFGGLLGFGVFGGVAEHLGFHLADEVGGVGLLALGLEASCFLARGFLLLRLVEGVHREFEASLGADVFLRHLPQHLLVRRVESGGVEPFECVQESLLPVGLAELLLESADLAEVRLLFFLQSVVFVAVHGRGERG